MALPGAKRISALACSPQNADLGFVGREDGSIVRVNWRSGAVDGELQPESAGRGQAHANEVTGLALSADGTKLLSVAGDELGVWDVAAGKGTMFRGRRGAANKDVALANFAPDGGSFPFNQGDTLHLRRLSDGLPLAELAGEAAFVRFALHLPEPGLLLASDDQALHLWRWTGDGRPPRKARTLKGAKELTRADLADDGSFCVACGDRALRAWRLPNAATLDAERVAGRVTFVSPQLDNDAATFHVEVDNRRRLLDVNGTATVVIEAE